MGLGDTNIVYSYEFEGVCLTTVILAPGASEVGLGAAGQVALRRDPGDPRDPRDPGNTSGRPLFIRRHRT